MERLDSLEERMSHLIRAVEDLSDVVAAQAREIDTLTRRVRQLAGARPRKLLETLAEEICACVLEEFSVRAVEVELRKYILPDTEYVAVRLSRESLRG